MKRLTATTIALGLLLVPVTMGAPSERKDPIEPKRNQTEAERSPATQKQNPQPPPQITFPFPFFPFRPDASLTPGTPPFTFPFLFPSLFPRPSNLARSADLSPVPVETFVILDGEDELRKSPTPDKKKQKKKKNKKKQKKPVVAYQKENQIALEVPNFPNFQPGLAGQFANGNQGSYTGYYMVYLVNVRWNGSNETQTIIAGRPVLTANPSPTESAQITDLTGALITEDPLKPPGTTQCFFQRSTTADLSGVGKPPSPTNQPDQEIISEEMEVGDDYYEDDPKKKKQKKSKTDAPVSRPTQ